MSDISFSGVDFSSFFDENFQKDLAAYFATPEGQANLAASGLQVPVVPTEPDYTQIVNDAYAPKYANYFGGLGTGGAGGTGDGETETERIARLDREAEDARRANELNFLQQAVSGNKRRKAGCPHHDGCGS
jgi:hypothetical protein